ncbi:hypothetical protein HYS72_00050 [Candidatus Pacearchaeota archaeon]|nr:hypothetical protein [Candidatus Pacearchaeota archaeon]
MKKFLKKLRGLPDEKVKAKRAKLSELISYEGAAQIVASELGINFENEKLKINELLPGMRKVNVVGKVINLFPVRTFKSKKGEESKVVNFVLADDTSNIKIVLWDTNHISLIEGGQVKKGSAIELKNASMRGNELHLGSFSELKISSELFDDSKIVTEKMVSEKKISEFAVSDSVKTRAFILQTFEPKSFSVCPECSKKAAAEGENFVCASHGKILPEKRYLMTIVLDDGTGTIRAVLFHENLAKIGLTELENIERLISQREDLLGKEMVFSGQVRNNKFFNEPEFVVDGVSEINLEALIEGLK